MKRTLSYISLLVVIVASLLAFPIAVSADTSFSDIYEVEAGLPDQVTVSITGSIMDDAALFGPTYLTAIISGGSILDGTYHGWCFDTDHGFAKNYPYTANVYSSYETLPVNLIEKDYNLDLVNYILNQGLLGAVSPGGYGVYNWADLQRAIWTLLDDDVPVPSQGPFSQYRVDEILSDAYANGEGFIPGCDEYVVIILSPLSGGIEGNIQLIGITIPLVCEEDEYEGLTPGYWKNQEEAWPPTGYSLDDDFDTVFGVDAFNPDKTLNDAVRLGGGGLKALARHAVAALLNAAHPDINYPYPVGDVIDMVAAAIDSGDYETTKDILDEANNLELAD